MKLISIGEAAKKIGVSIDTLRRWDKAGRFKASRKSGKRVYLESEIDDFVKKSQVFTSDFYDIAQEWVSNLQAVEPENLFYCANSLIFQTRLVQLERDISQLAEIKNIFPLISAIVGEIGNNSFDHNLGNWSDIPGIFFGYDLKKKEIVLADRGQGILKTLKRVKPELDSDENALRVAFSEVISGRAPEARGNGLKFVKKIIQANDMTISFQTGSAKLEMGRGQMELDIQKQNNVIHGCLVLIKF